jgi:hypothetical protein
MTLGDYILSLQELVLLRPEANDFEVIFASDDEGNAYQAVTCTPTIGHCSDEYFKEFTAEVDFEEADEWINPNCVCIN